MKDSRKLKSLIEFCNENNINDINHLINTIVFIKTTQDGTRLQLDEWLEIITENEASYIMLNNYLKSGIPKIRQLNTKKTEDYIATSKNGKVYIDNINPFIFQGRTMQTAYDYLENQQYPEKIRG